MRRPSTRHGGAGGSLVNVSSVAVRPGIIDTDIHASGGQSDRVQRVGATVLLDGRASMDPDGRIVRYACAQTEGRPVTLSGATAATASFSAPVLENTSVLGFTLTVTDDSGEEAQDSVRIHVTLCISLEHGEDEKLANDIASVFRRMFGEHLDILFLSDSQEVEIRKVCCPFFTTNRFSHPDFYLTSSEGYNLEEIRARYKEKQLIGVYPDGYMLCEIEPPVLGQRYELGEQDIHKIIIASRHSGYSIFSINKWPAYVHVARLLSSEIGHKTSINEDDIEPIAWAELYESREAARTAVVRSKGWNETT